MSSRHDAKPYTVASTAPRAAINAAHRGVLIALRDELEMLCVDIENDGAWPADVAWAVEVLQLRERGRRTLLTRWHKPTEIVDDLMPGDDQDFVIALAVVPYTNYALGITHDAGEAYCSYDCGHEAYFRLTDAEHALASDYIATQGADPGLLIRCEEQRRLDEG